MSRVRLACIGLALVYGGFDLSIGSGSFLATAVAKGHGGHKGGGHKGGHKKSHPAARHHAVHHHAAQHHSQHHAKQHAHHLATGHTAHKAHTHARHHVAHHHNHHHHHHHHWHNGHRYWVGNGYYGGSYVDGGTVVNGSTVTGDGTSAIVAPSLVGSAATLAYPTVLGSIGAISGNALTIVRSNGRVMKVSATPSTVITLNSNPAMLTDLQITDRVKASYDPESNAVTLVAHRD